ncbi:unnamed protein product, partial [Discosporangium mesarthrocarpum]
MLGLTMVPPVMMNSSSLHKFRADWMQGLKEIQYRIYAGEEQGRLHDPLVQVGRTPFHLAHQGLPDLPLMAVLAGSYHAAAPSLVYTAPHLQGGPASVQQMKIDSRPVRVGFVSLHLRDHSIGRMLALLIMALAEDEGMDVHIIAVGRNGVSHVDGRARKEDVGREGGSDPVVQALRGSVEGWHEIALDMGSAREVIGELRPDVLVYPDIGMDAFTYFLSFSRLAPVQCVWWGHPVTPATGSLDYFLSLEVEEAEGQRDYMEQVVRMDLVNTAPFVQVQGGSRNRAKQSGSPHASVVTAHPSSSLLAEGASEPNAGPPLAGEHGAVLPSEGGKNSSSIPRVACLGQAEGNSSNLFTAPPAGQESTFLPPGTHLYLVLGRLFKLHPEFDEAVAGILEEDPDGCVVLIHEKQEEEWTRAIWRRLMTKLTPLGETERLKIVHHWNYPSTLQRSSAVLDTFPYGGCLTVLEALSANVPVVTFPSDLLRGRFALALYRQMGLTGLVARDIKSYVTIAVRLGTDPVFQGQAREAVRVGYAHHLHHNEESAREWAQFFRRALAIA